MPWRRRRHTGPGGGGLRGFSKGRLLIIAVIAAFALFKYWSNREENPHTGRTQSVAWSPEEEVAIGLQAAPQMVQQHGGRLDNPEAQALVRAIGTRLINEMEGRGAPYQFEFTVLAHPTMINAFALPGGQVFITRALLAKLETEAAVAGVIGHEIGHVMGRHGSERAAKAALTQGLTAAAIIGAGQNSAKVAQVIGGLVNMKYGREQELESDKLGVRYMVAAKYDPRALKQVMKVLQEAGGDRKQPEFASTHPHPERRIEKIQEEIDRIFPDGVPEGFDK